MTTTVDIFCRFKLGVCLLDMNNNLNSRKIKLRCDNPLLTLIVPVYNEEESIELFYNRGIDVLECQDFRFEFLFIDDGSSDKSINKLQELSIVDDRVKFIKLSRNFGKEAALTAGIDAANGDAIIPIDVDLQDPIEVIPEFFAKWQQGFDVVYGLRKERKVDGPIKRITANWFYKLFNKFSGVKLPEDAGDFRIMDRKVVDALKLLPENTRFMKGLFSWVGFKSTSHAYSRPKRVAGTTKWNYWKLWNFALDGIFCFSSVPLRIWSYVGGVISVGSFIYASILVIRTVFYGVTLPGYASIMVSILFLGGLQLLSIGIIGEYIGRIMTEAKKRPIYIVEYRSFKDG